MSYDLGTTGLASHLSIGRIIEVHPDTYTADVYIQEGKGIGRTVEAICPVTDKDEATRTGIICLPNHDDEIYLDWSYGPVPQISGHTTQLFNVEKKKEYKTRITPIRSFGSEDKFYQQSGRRPYRFGPTDIMPNDKVFMGPLGNFLGILAGGVSILKGGPLSQIILSKFRDCVKIIAGNFELFSNFGQLRMFTRSGRNIVELVGNADTQKSNKHTQSDWDYEFRINGRNLFDMKLMKDKFQFSVNADGHITLKSAASATIELNKPATVNIIGDQEKNIDGAYAKFITGDAQRVIRGLDTEKVGRKVFLVSGAYNSLVSGSYNATYMSTKVETIRGTSITSIDTIGCETRVAAGDYSVVIGNPLDLGIPAPLLLAQAKTGDFKVSTFSGDFTFLAAIKGDLNYLATLGQISMFTVAGGVSIGTGLGNVSLSTGLGNAELSTLGGNVAVTTLLGNAEFGTSVGNAELKALVGAASITGGLCKGTFGPAGIKLQNGPLEGLALIDELITLLGTTTAPGFGGPITTAPQFIELGIRWKLFKGA